jgi:hypothetical protein
VSDQWLGCKLPSHEATYCREAEPPDKDMKGRRNDEARMQRSCSCSESDV